MAGSKSNGIDIDPSDWARAPAVDNGPFLQRCMKVIYNPEEKTFFGRTAKRWGIVLLFYGVYYALVAALFAICMFGLKYSLPEDRPRRTLDDSLLGASPGVGYRPLPRDKEQVRYDRANPEDYKYYQDNMTYIYDSYETGDGANSTSDCVKEKGFGYPDNPCFYIKLNKLFDWEPKFYTAPHKDMPDDLAEEVKAAQGDERNRIWISCEEYKNSNDKDTNNTKIEYPFKHALSPAQYPYRNQKVFVNPVIAVQFTPPHNKDVLIRCRAWAENIEYDSSVLKPRGYVMISLHIVDNTVKN